MKTTINPLTKFLLIASAFCAFHRADAALLTYWNFNNVSPAWNGSLLGSFNTAAASYGEAYTQTSNSTPGTLASNTSNSTVFSGSGIKIDFANIATITSPTINGKTPPGYTAQNATSGNAGYGTFVGYTLNAVGSDAAGDSLLLLNTSGNMRTKYITLSLSSVGYDTLTLSYATRLTNSVTSQQVWTYSTDGTNFSALSTISPTANGTAQFASLDLSALSSNTLNNQSAFYLRMTYTSANTQGSQAIDNLQLTGTAIPEPSTWALLAFSLTSVVVLRRRLKA